MAVYTEVADDTLAAFLAHYDLGRALSFKGIAEGVENSNYFLKTERGEYILTLYEKRVRPEDLPFFLGLMDHLAARGIACPTPVHGKDGKALRKLCSRPAAMVSFLPGVSPRRPSVKHCGPLGTALAHMHVAGADFGIKRVNALSVGGWRPIFDKCRERADEVKKGLADEIAEELQYLEAHWPKVLPTGVIHADLFPDNVFFIDHQLSGLIDFYFACNDFFAYDIAVCLNAWCFEPDVSFNITKAHAMLAAYRRVRDFSKTELKALPLLARGAALRFLLTRLHDWLHHPPGALVTPKNPLEYYRKLRFHQRVRNPGEYGLD